MKAGRGQRQHPRPSLLEAVGEILRLFIFTLRGPEYYSPAGYVLARGNHFNREGGFEETKRGTDRI
jgi:hypothetical protein